MMAKSKIEEAYGKYYDTAKKYIREEGWIYQKESPYLMDASFQMTTNIEIQFQKRWEYDPTYAHTDKGYRWRPISLRP